MERKRRMVELTEQNWEWLREVAFRNKTQIKAVTNKIITERHEMGGQNE